jgi:hypothetical protein
MPIVSEWSVNVYSPNQLCSEFLGKAVLCVSDVLIIDKKPIYPIGFHLLLDFLDLRMAHLKRKLRNNGRTADRCFRQLEQELRKIFTGTRHSCRLVSQDQHTTRSSTLVNFLSAIFPQTLHSHISARSNRTAFALIFPYSETLSVIRLSVRTKILAFLTFLIRFWCGTFGSAVKLSLVPTLGRPLEIYTRSYRYIFFLVWTRFSCRSCVQNIYHIVISLYFTKLTTDLLSLGFSRLVCYCANFVHVPVSGASRDSPHLIIYQNAYINPTSLRQGAFSSRQSSSSAQNVAWVYGALFSLCRINS